MIKYLTSENIYGRGEYNRDFIIDVTHCEDTKTPVKVEYLSEGRIRIQPTSGRFPSGRSDWRHNNEKRNIIAKRSPLKVKLDDDLFEL